MQVYAVIGGFSYGGEDFCSLRLFDCKSAAEKYQQELKDEEGYDYALISVKEVSYESALFD